MKGLRSHRVRLGLALLAMGLSVSAIGTTAVAAVAKRAPKSSNFTTITIGADRETQEAFIWNINSFLAKYHIKADLEQFTNYPASLQALAKGEIDFGILGIEQMDTMASSNITNVKVITGFDLAGQNLVLGSGVNATTWKQLEGRTIAAPLSTGTGILLEIALLQAGVLNKVHLVDGGFVGTTYLEAMKTHKWAGFAFWSPTPDEGALTGEDHYVSTLNINCTTIGPANGVIGANTGILKHRAVVVDFLKAFVASMNYDKTHPNAWVQQASEVTGTGPSYVRASLKYLDIQYGIDVTAAERAAAYGPKFGYAKTDAASKIPGVVDASFLSAATGESVAQIEAPVKMPPGKAVCPS